MPAFLCLRLHGPLAAWGDIAVGEQRPSSVHPSRSAVLGLVAGALGVRRTDSDQLAALDRELGFGSRTESPGSLLVDFHTAQGPAEATLRKQQREAKREKRPWQRPATRQQELSRRREDLETMLSQRQYRVDALWTIALWRREHADPAQLQAVAAALRQPHFVPYLGRKSCPVDIPFEPQILEASNPIEALGQARFHTDDLLAPVLEQRRGARTVQWEGEWPDAIATQTIRRRDQLLSRSRWQFVERDEHVGLCPEDLVARNGGADVSQQG